MSSPPAEPSPRALGESLAALAAQLADLRGQVRAINDRLDQAGLRAEVNLAARFEDLARTVADALDAAAPAGPPPHTGSVWTATPATRDWPSCGAGPIPCCASTTAATSCGLLAPPHPRRLGTVHPSRRMAPHLQRRPPRSSPGPGVPRPLAARHHAPHHRHHPHMHAAMRGAPQPRRPGCSSRIPLIPAARRLLCSRPCRPTLQADALEVRLHAMPRRPACGPRGAAAPAGASTPATSAPR